MILNRRTDLPLSRDPSSRQLPWLVGFMVYVATLALAGGFYLGDMVSGWEKGLTGTLTVELPANTDDAATAVGKADEVIKLIRRTKGVADARVLSTEEVGRLLQPWLGSVTVEDLPVPTLIAVRLEEGETVDIHALDTQIDAVYPGSVVDDHALWRQRLVGTVTALEAVAALVVLIVGIAAVSIVVFATKGGLFAHRQVIELLHLIGATDDYIAGQFQWHALKSSFRGGIIASLCAFLTLTGLIEAASLSGAQMTLSSLYSTLEWAGLGIIPFITAGIAMWSARRTVLHALSRML